MKVGTLITRKATAFAVVLALTFAAAAAFTTQAYASDTPWNSNVTVTAYADDPTYDNDAQHIDVTMTFASSLLGVTAADMQAYLQDNITIAGRTIAADDDGYTRAVSDVVISGSVVTFDIGPNSEGMTANYSAELYIAANTDANPLISQRMGYAPVETVIDSGLDFARISSSSAAATFQVTDRAQARSMNHVLITDVINGQETTIFSGDSGAFEYGGITVHSHSFFDQMPSDYATALVEAAQDATLKDGLSYTFTDNGDGTFTVVNNNGSSENIQVYLYACDYLNAHTLSVGDIYEPEWSVTHPED